MWRTRLLTAAAAVAVAASPPACRAGLGSFQVNISDGRRLDGGNHTLTHAERDWAPKVPVGIGDWYVKP